MTHLNATADNLDSLMGITELPIQVHADGTVTEAREYDRPELYMYVDADGSAPAGADEDLIRDARQGDWELTTGWTGQYSYNGPVMHASEYIGGGMADHILSTPGIYATAVVECIGVDGDMEDEPAGWVVAYRAPVD